MDLNKIDGFHQLSDREMRALIEKSGHNTGNQFSLAATLRLWYRRIRDRRQMRRDLPSFTAAVLEDFGLSRAEAERQARKPFWRA